MTTAEIITIGTELLLGEIQDTNTRDIAIFLRNHGIDLFRATIVGDNANRIAAAIQDSLARTDIVITTGGLGPTVDDPTRDAVALAVGTHTEFSPELWRQIEERFQRFDRVATENNKKQAFIPSGAIPVENRVGTAPAFIVESGSGVIISLPGVPRELEYLLHEKILPYLVAKFQLGEIIKARILHAAGIGESQVDERIGDLESSINPSVGLAAHPGQVDIRITAKATNHAAADEMIDKMAFEIKKRLGDWIYGENDDTLERNVLRKLLDKKLKLAIFHHGLGNGFTTRLIDSGFPSDQIYPLDRSIDATETFIYDLIKEKSQMDSVDVVCGAVLDEGKEKQKLQLILTTSAEQLEEKRNYGGPPALSQDWAANQVFDFLRRNL